MGWPGRVAERMSFSCAVSGMGGAGRLGAQGFGEGDCFEVGGPARMVREGERLPRRLKPSRGWSMMAGLKSRPFESEVDGAILSGPRGGGGESLRCGVGVGAEVCLGGGGCRVVVEEGEGGEGE